MFLDKSKVFAKTILTKIYFSKVKFSQRGKPVFVGRKNELSVLEDTYKKPGFQMTVIYGRRRIGKSRLIYEALMDRRGLIDKRYEEVEFLLFSLTGFSKWVKENARTDRIRLVTLEELY